MIFRVRRLSACLLSLALIAIAQNVAADTVLGAPPLSMLLSKGTHLVDATGREVVLKGCNLGNALMFEAWMFGGTLTVDGEPFRDGKHLSRTLATRFGQEETEKLISTYRDGWITPRDFEQIKSLGFNAVRLPFDYRDLQTDQAPFLIKKDGFRSIDRILQLAEAAGVYVILDLHGVPGGQSTQDHTGEAGQNKFWTSELNQRRTVDVWRAVAERYKDRAVVAAYDLINEPYSDHRSDERATLAAVMQNIYNAIRQTGDNHVIYFAAGFNTGLGFYGDLRARGMSNVGFTEHYYPGLFGSLPALETQARVLNQELPAKAAYLSRLGVPYLVGEFNVVLQSEHPNRVMRAYFDRFAEYGWAGTMWSYKLIKREGGSAPSAWYMVTNAQPLPEIDMTTASIDQIRSSFAQTATMPLAVNEPLRAALTSPKPSPLYLTPFPELPTQSPATPQSDPDGYTSADIGGPNAGHTAAMADGRVVLIAGGEDINGSADSFRFISKPAKPGEIDQRATIASFVDTQQYAKAGVMVRWGNAEDASKPGAPMAMVNVFPDGTMAFISRRRADANATERKAGACVSLPVELRLQGAGRSVTASYRTPGEEWQTVGTVEMDVKGPARTGLAVCPHSDVVLTTVEAYLDEHADIAIASKGRAIRPESSSLLRNGFFAQQGNSTDRAAEWNNWGKGLVRQTSHELKTPRQGETAYLYWKANGREPAGLWQEVPADPGARYTFLINAQADTKTSDEHPAGTIELQLESIADDGEIMLNSKIYDLSKLAAGDSWTHLAVGGTAQSERLRVLVVLKPSRWDRGSGNAKLTDAMLTIGENAR